jgi:hypothetical protein
MECGQMTNIEIAVSEEVSTTEKGRLLEKLGREVLEAMQYEVIEEVRLTGIEVDLLAKHKVSSEVVYIECKAYKDTTTISADVLTKLLGNVLFRNVSSGWLFTTGPLGKDAKGFVVDWEQKPLDQRKMLHVYTADRLLDAIISTGRVCDPASIKYPSNLQFSDNCSLLITNYGRFWAVPLIHATAGVPYGVMLFDAKSGEPISDQNTIEVVSKIDSSFSDLMWKIPTDNAENKDKDSLAEEAQSVVTVTSGDQWADYRPSRPQDFVGRDELQTEVFKFLEGVRNSSIPTRLLALKAPSGWGKSSMLLKIAEKSKGTKYKNKFFFYAVDVRAATSQRYAEFALLECLNSAIKSKFVSKPKNTLRITGTNNPFSDSSFEEVLDTLRTEGKVIVLFFDQFEEIFSKKELANLFESIRKLSAAIDSAQENIVLGFAWKTDGTVPTDHPAYYMWHNLSDRRKEYSLTPFSSKDISKALNIFSKELDTPLNPVLRKYLIDHCQGYPWLLKKLCIHVYSFVKGGSDQVEVLGRGLNINDLFEKDTSELSAAELACVKRIAQESPVELFQMVELYGDTTVQSLINKRLILRKGQKLILYWDIFRDYILTGNVPKIPVTYIPQSQFRSYYNALQILMGEKVINISDFAAKLGIGRDATENIMRDLVMVGNASRHGETLEPTFDTEMQMVQKLVDFLADHIVYKSLVEEFGLAFQLNPDSFNDYFKGIYESSSFSEKTWKVYSARLIGWFRGSGIMDYKLNKLINNFDKTAKILVKSPLKISKLKTRRGSNNNFLGEAPPERTLELISLIAAGHTKELELKSMGYRNALTVLKTLGMVATDEEDVILLEKRNDISDWLMQRVLETPIMQVVKEAVDNNCSITTAEVGRIVGDALSKDWKDTSHKRYGSALILWLRWATKDRDSQLTK